MKFSFYKYQGAGNDFVIIDNRKAFFPKEDTQLIAKICNRKFGVGADGLMLLEKSTQANFTMVYYNSDGNQSTMCGNGGRCIVHFAEFLGIISGTATFMAVDGLHQATIKDNWVSLKMNDVKKIDNSEDFTFLNTGSPHHVEIVADLENYEVVKNGRLIRENRYGTEGANVNFVKQINADKFSVRTYERGVEDETLSCGTGVTAVAIAMFERGITNKNKISLLTPGGELQVRFNKDNSIYKNVYLEGPAVQVFKGKWQ
ncbi:MAG: diaminopimelate epimerase [Aequorivita sp.]|nr:diaminopimelate epimerase [Aequorivita sp.]|tara:strand:+ start:12179 stop:12952 length:774 start_codon:yes stop_codon:yes gene_type:complete